MMQTIPSRELKSATQISGTSVRFDNARLRLLRERSRKTSLECELQVTSGLTGAIERVEIDLPEGELRKRRMRVIRTQADEFDEKPRSCIETSFSTCGVRFSE